ncbi:efflux RND transporter periplasmic adaptor subunit [Eleftheria terrae]|uniref:efflux RND transporter periplasmic adaptor subunit n=1 Tax=Eleftheria terrae TaxID=1597781 RepID=UPI00263BC716|nr:efflux RND transporter periplasmic adaptor subunit [Eleftheria terrae]WKB52582.1 efflux RND transporter periplasmic adaptor subunit [Eleftheria terrae]
MKFKQRWAVGGVLLLAALAGIAAWRAGQDAPLSYRTALVEQGSLQASVSAAGTVTAVAQVQVGSQVSGQINEVLADFNSEVRKGQLIARLDPQSFEYRVQQAQADVEAARAAVLTAQANALASEAALSRARLEAAQAGRDLQRSRELLAREFISPAELERSRAQAETLAEAQRGAEAQRSVAQAQVRNAEATVRQREAQLAQAKVDLQRTQIRSPVDGIVIKRSIELGQTVAASLQSPELFVIARNLEDMQLEVPVDEADIGRVQPGQSASFTVDAFPGLSHTGRVKQVRKAATSTQNVVTYTVVVGFSQPGSRLLPGMTANVRIVTDVREQVLKVPNAALRVRLPAADEAARAASAPRRERGARAPGAGRHGEAGGGSAGRVLVLPRGGGEPRAVPVRLGISDGAMTEVLGGELKAGDTVVVGVHAPAGGDGGPRAPGGPRLGF